MKTKQIILSGLIFVLGFSCGFVILSSLISSAQKTYIDCMYLQFREDQSVKAVKATKSGDVYGALVHRQNVVDTFKQKDDILNFFLPDLSFWSLLQSLIVNTVKDSTFNIKGEQLSEGIERGKLAYQYDNLGASAQAKHEWTLAAQLAGYSNRPQEFKKLISEMIESEKNM